MAINKLLLKQAVKIEKQSKLAEWSKDFETVEAMLADGISWKTITVVLSKKYKKEYQTSALVRIYNRQYLGNKIKNPNIELPQTIQFDQPIFESGNDVV